MMGDFDLSGLLEHELIHLLHFHAHPIDVFDVRPGEVFDWRADPPRRRNILAEYLMGDWLFHLPIHPLRSGLWPLQIHNLLRLLLLHILHMLHLITFHSLRRCTLQRQEPLLSRCLLELYLLAFVPLEGLHNDLQQLVVGGGFYQAALDVLGKEVVDQVVLYGVQVVEELREELHDALHLRFYEGFVGVLGGWGGHYLMIKYDQLTGNTQTSEGSKLLNFCQMNILSKGLSRVIL